MNLIQVWILPVRPDMARDFKTGMFVGLLLAAAALIWLSTRPGLGVKARMLRSYNSIPSGKDITAGKQAEISAPIVPLQADSNKPAEVAVQEQPEKIKIQKFHIVRKDETLSDISFLYYGTTKKWQKILDANQDVIKDADKLRAGIKLIIPE